MRNSDWLWLAIMRCRCGERAYEATTSTGEALGVWYCERCGKPVQPTITGPTHIEDSKSGTVMHTTRGGLGHVGRVYADES